MILSDVVIVGNAASAAASMASAWAARGAGELVAMARVEAVRLEHA